MKRNGSKGCTHPLRPSLSIGNYTTESGPLRAVLFSRHKWPGGLGEGICCPVKHHTWPEPGCAQPTRQPSHVYPTQLRKDFRLRSTKQSVTLSVATSLCHYRTACHRACGLSTSGVFEKNLQVPCVDIQQVAILQLAPIGPGIGYPLAHTHQTRRTSTLNPNLLGVGREEVIHIYQGEDIYIYIYIVIYIIKKYIYNCGYIYTCKYT